MEPQLSIPAPPDTVPDKDAFTLAYLSAHEAQCPACGYNVHALTQPRCPECGRGLVVRIVPAEGGFTVPWVASLITSALAAGIGLLVVAVVATEGIHGPGALRYILVYFMANIPVPFVVLALGRRFVRWRLWVQYGLAGVLALATGGMLAWFIAYVR